MDMLTCEITFFFRSEFAESTILTIAHRLRTIIDYDRVGTDSWILVSELTPVFRSCFLTTATSQNLIGIHILCLSRLNS